MPNPEPEDAVEREETMEWILFEAAPGQIGVWPAHSPEGRAAPNRYRKTIPVVPKSALLAAQQRAEEQEKRANRLAEACKRADRKEKEELELQLMHERHMRQRAEKQEGDYINGLKRSAEKAESERDAAEDALVKMMPDDSAVLVPIKDLEAVGQRAEKAEAERDAWILNSEAGKDGPSVLEIVAERDDYKARVERLENALRWYADVGNYYLATNATRPAILADDGGRAREALSTPQAREP